MKLVLGGINGNYLRNILEGDFKQVEEVVAAVAYATEASLLFEWCLQHKIPLKFYGRLDEDVAVSLPVLKWFLDQRSPNYTCRLVEHHHAKIIWWKGRGLYIGSANLTHKAWYTNIEAGCFFEEEEISDIFASDIAQMLDTMNKNATPLTDEVYKIMRIRAFEREQKRLRGDDFWKNPSLKTWGGLSHSAPKFFVDRRQANFLEEWHSTIQYIRDIGVVISRDENRPKWIPKDTPTGAQADQFLHAHYYQRTFEDGRAEYLKHYQRNCDKPDLALREAINWWRSLRSAPSSEDEMLAVSAPYLRNSLTPESLALMNRNTFEEVCSKVHAIRDYSRRVNNASVKLPAGRRYSIPEKISALADRIWNDRTGNGSSVVQQLNYILYGGTKDDLPSRLWSAVSSQEWKIDGLGISALGEIVGWALPETFPPRNGRTSKALKSLGYDVTVHV